MRRLKDAITYLFLFGLVFGFYTLMISSAMARIGN